MKTEVPDLWKPWNLPDFDVPWANVGPWALHADTGDWYRPLAYLYVDAFGTHQVLTRRVRLTRADCAHSLSPHYHIEKITKQLQQIWSEFREELGHDPY